MILPRFVCIGAQKSGTTWLYEQLRRNPEIHLPSKEVNFFFRKEQPLERYAQEFAGARPNQVAGDISPVYSVGADVAARLIKALPDAKLILLIRNPVDRAWSQYKMATASGNIAGTTSFLEAFFANQQYMQRRGRYAEIIADYGGEKLVGRRLLVVDFALIASQPGAVIDLVSRFIGVAPVIDHDAAATRFAAAKSAGKISRADAEHVAAYYREPNRELIDILGWKPAWCLGVEPRRG